MNKLQKHVSDWLNTYKDKGYEHKQELFEDLQRGGCASGMVGHLIYHSDTKEFYQKYRSEIESLVTDLMESTGLSINELFGDKWDETDPFANDTQNQNLLAWFGFEETAFKLMEY